MAKFKGELTIKVSFKGLGVPVGFGMTNAIIYHHCATQVGIQCPWTRVDKLYKKDPRFKVKLLEKKVLIDEE